LVEGSGAVVDQAVKLQDIASQIRIEIDKLKLGIEYFHTAWREEIIAIIALQTYGFVIIEFLTSALLK